MTPIIIATPYLLHRKRKNSRARDYLLCILPINPDLHSGMNMPREGH